jgi:hypothetical protein
MQTTRRVSPSDLRLRAGLPPARQVDRLEWAAGLAVESFGLRIGLRTSVPEALEPAAGRLPPGRPLPAGRVDLLYSLVLGGPGPRPGMRRSHRLYCGDTRIASSLDLDPLLDTLESHARLHVAARSRRGVFLHAGAVAWRDRAIVLPGASRSGKTTLVAELVKAGAGYLSDEFAVIRGDRVVPYPKPLSVRDPGRGGRQRPLTASALGGWHERRSLPVGLVVLATFEPGAAGRARRLRRGRALLSLLSHAVAARIAPQEVLAALEGLVRSAPVVRVRRGDARAEARRILRRVERAA